MKTNAVMIFLPVLKCNFHFGQTPPNPEMATAADGPQPTGMHSYLK